MGLGDNLDSSTTFEFTLTKKEEHQLIDEWSDTRATCFSNARELQRLVHHLSKIPTSCQARMSAEAAQEKEGKVVSSQSENEDYVCEETASNLPWFSANKTDPEKKLEETVFYKHLLEGGNVEKGKFKSTLYRILNEAFPYYLHRKYYSMDAKALADKPSFACFTLLTAANTVMKIVSHGSSLYYDLSKSLGKKDHNIISYENLLYKLKEVRNCYLTDIDKSQTPEEFLFEPWVLIQLPFYPAVLHQWIVLGLAEHLKFRKELAFFCALCVPKKLHSLLDYLIQAADCLHQALVAMLHVLQIYQFLHTSYDHPYLFDPICRLISDCLSKAVPILKFLTSGQSYDIIKAVKRKAWSDDKAINAVKRKVTKKDNWSTCCPNCNRFSKRDTDDTTCFLYTCDFWSNDDKLGNFFGDNIPAIKKCASAPNYRIVSKKQNAIAKPMSLPSVGKVISDIYPKSCKTDHLPDVKTLLRFIDEKIIDPGWLKGASKSEMHSKIKQCEHLESLRKAFSHYLWHSENSQGICSADSGVLFDINNLTSELAMEQILGAIISLLHGVVKRGASSEVYIDAVGCEGPELSFLEIEKSLPPVEPKRKWKFESVLAEIQKQCPPPETVEFPGDDVNTSTVLEILEARVKNIVYQMLRNRLDKPIKGKALRGSYPEQPIVQYILPSLISCGHSFLTIATCDPGIIRLYSKFLHHLIDEFKPDRCCVVTHDTIKSNSTDIFKLLWDRSVIEFMSMHNHKVRRVLEIVQQLFEPFERIFENLLHMFSFASPHLNIFTNQVGWQVTFVDWNLFAYRFYSKLLFALELTAKEQSFPLKPVSEKDLYSFNCGAMRVFLHIIGALDAYNGGKALLLQDKKLLQCVIETDELARTSKDSSLEKLTRLKLSRWLAAFFYTCLRNPDFRAKSAAERRTVNPITPLDSVERAFNAYMSEDWWELKQEMLSWNYVEGFGDQSQVTLKFAQGERDIYGKVLDSLGPEMKVKMEYPGRITFLPIKHCRWCGLVDAPQLRLCDLCRTEEDYMDKTYFCSDKCESSAMDDIHGEEHAAILCTKLKM